MPGLDDKIGNILANIIRVVGNIDAIAIDGIDGYATIRQVKREIGECLVEIEASLQGLE